MFKSKLFQIVIAMLIVITLILTAFFVLWNYMDKKDKAEDADPKSAVESVQGKKLSASQIKDNTFILKDVVTNLSEKDRIIKASFAFELDSKKAKEEFEKLDFKVKSIITLTLADMTREQVSGSKGQDSLTATLMNKINPVLTEGKLKQVSITDIIVQ
ncbi:flagellar basal body-associated FliL family protein [Paenibacillus sp. MBLB4367]|uniref:flagellar basal body-associated FliL family protein n=1 Tax=Paenibacillus sp. MBLB4367 TaxID=3384767 RepID=UPI0039084354